MREEVYRRNIYFNLLKQMKKDLSNLMTLFNLCFSKKKMECLSHFNIEKCFAMGFQYLNLLLKAIKMQDIISVNMILVLNYQHLALKKTIIGSSLVMKNMILMKY